MFPHTITYINNHRGVIIANFLEAAYIKKRIQKDRCNTVVLIWVVVEAYLTKMA